MSDFSHESRFVLGNDRVLYRGFGNRANCETRGLASGVCSYWYALQITSLRD
jgi:hypothetical protein